MGNQIPEQSRELVKRRAMGRCLRCGGPGSEWHHRRSRSVRDSHRHCPCNGAWLCSTCHKWVHAHPFEAKAEGFIVSKYVSEPGSIRLTAHFGDLFLDCLGKFEYDAVDPLARMIVTRDEIREHLDL